MSRNKSVGTDKKSFKKNIKNNFMCTTLIHFTHSSSSHHVCITHTMWPPLFICVINNNNAPCESRLCYFAALLDMELIKFKSLLCCVYYVRNIYMAMYTHHYAINICPALWHRCQVYFVINDVASLDIKRILFLFALFFRGISVGELFIFINFFLFSSSIDLCLKKYFNGQASMLHHCMYVCA